MKLPEQTACDRLLEVMVRLVAALSSGRSSMD